MAVAILPALCVAQDGWLYAWRNQPSGEFAPDYRKVDPFQPMFSDADLESQAARKAPSFLTQFASNVKTSALRDADTASILDAPEFDAPEFDAPELDAPEFDAPEFDALAVSDAADYEHDPAMPAAHESAQGSADYTQLDELMPQIETDLPITPQQVFSNAPAQCNTCFGWQVLPQGLMYKSYIAGEKEPRMQFIQLYDTRSKQRIWDAVLGGRVGLLRHGNYDSVNPQGFQIDVEGAVFARVLPDEPSAMLQGSDYRAGLLGTNRYNGTAVKYGYYHVSSHIGDEFLLANPTFNRINYVRDSVIAGVTQDLKYSTQVYGEIAYAVGAEAGAKPLEFQFGTQYLPVAKSSLRGAPYIAANYHIREDFGFEGGFNTVAGWGWQGLRTQHRFRIGMQYYNGPSLQYQFLNKVENLFGGGIWYDY